jgi:hypothetical protein
LSDSLAADLAAWLAAHRPPDAEQEALTPAGEEVLRTLGYIN